MSDGGLTPQQEAYARARAMGMDIAEAHIAADVSVSINTAYKWDRLPIVRARIEKLSMMATENAILQTGLTREWVISRLMTVVERCLQAEQVLDAKGEPTGEYKFDSSGANQALKMLGDTMGLYKPADKKPEDEYNNLSDEDIARIARDLAAEVGLLEHVQE